MRVTEYESSWGALEKLDRGIVRKVKYQWSDHICMGTVLAACVVMSNLGEGVYS